MSDVLKRCRLYTAVGMTYRSLFDSDLFLRLHLLQCFCISICAWTSSFFACDFWLLLLDLELVTVISLLWAFLAVGSACCSSARSGERLSTLYLMATGDHKPNMLNKTCSTSSEDLVDLCNAWAGENCRSLADLRCFPVPSLPKVQSNLTTLAVWSHLYWLNYFATDL